MTVLALAIFGAVFVPREEILVLEPSRACYLLSNPGVIQGSLVIEHRDTGWCLLADSVIFEPPPAETIAVKVRYLTLEEEVTKTFRRHNSTLETRFGDTLASRSKPYTSDNLKVHGAKTFSIEIDNKGSSDVGQSLVVDVEGELAEVDIRTHLADEQGSFDPSGTTERIEDFDRISVELSQKTWNLGLGDLDMSYPVSGYGLIERRLQGMMGEITLKGFKTQAALGLEGTRKGHETLSPKDGKRGPYFIDSRQPIIPASERVWLDGTLLERGWDYTLEYSTGELLFNNQLYFDENSKIEVDYNYAGSEYSSNNQLAATGYGPFEVFYFREADSRTHLYHTWSDEQQAILDTASGTEIVLPGGRFVGENNGSYLLDNGHYVWTGFGEGSYEVSFRKAESGDYSLDADSGFYRYVGPDSGDYRAEILIPLPSREDVLGVCFKREVGPVSLDAVALGSRLSPNLYNNGYFFLGHAHKVSANWKGERTAVSFSHRLKLPHSLIPATGDEVGTRDRWNLDSLPESLNEQTLSFAITPLDSFDVAIEAAHLWTDSHKFRASLSSEAKTFDASADWLRERQRARALLHPRIGVFTPRIGLSFTNFTSLPRRSFEPMAGLRVEPLKELTMEVSLSRRIDQAADSSWHDTLHYDRLAFNTDWNRNKLSVLTVLGVERYLPRGNTSDSGWKALFGDMRAYWSPNPAVRINADLSQRIVQTVSTIYQYLPVEPGTGDYTRDAETGEYVPSENGDYRQVAMVDDSSGLGIERKASLGTDLKFNPINFRATLTYDETPSYHSLLASGRITLLPHFKPLTVILNPTYRNQKLPSWGASEEQLSCLETRAELRSRVHPHYLLRLEASANQERRYRGEASLRSRDNYQVKLSPILDLWLTLEPEVGFARLLAEEPMYYPELGEITLRKVWLGCDAEKQLGLWRITTGAELTSRQANVPSDLLPYLISEDDPPGLEPSWLLGVERSFKIGGENLSFRAKYEGRLYPDYRGLENSFELSAGMYF